MKPFSAMPAYQEIIDVLRSAVSDTGLITDPADISAAALDGRGRRQGEALAVVRPASTEEVSLVMKTAAAYGLSVIPQGGNTSNVGGATPEPGASAETARRTLILQLGHMKRILNVDTVNNTITLEAGVVLQDAQKAASDAGRLLPLSLAAEGSCQTGGVIAANAGGVHVLRYGMARRQVLGLKVVLASGEVLDLMKGLRKDNSGYSLRDVYIGSPKPSSRSSPCPALSSRPGSRLVALKTLKRSLKHLRRPSAPVSPLSNSSVARRSNRSRPSRA